MTRHQGLINILATVFAAFALTVLFSAPVYAHCDGIDGPVVTSAREALAKGDVFRQTVTVRQLSPEARELANLYVFETLVRLHRAGRLVAQFLLWRVATGVSEAGDR